MGPKRLFQTHLTPRDNPEDGRLEFHVFHDDSETKRQGVQEANVCLQSGR